MFRKNQGSGNNPARETLAEALPTLSRSVVRRNRQALIVRVNHGEGFFRFREQKMLDPLSPDLQPLNELLSLLPQRPSPPTVWRWITKGKNGTRLESLKIANKLYSTEAEVRRFLCAIQSPTQQVANDESSEERELKRRGILNG